MLRVLLVSPLDPDIPKNLKFLMGGESTYTKSLLANPPKGVVYTHHLDALRQGQVENLPMQRILSTLVKVKILPTSSGSQCLRINGKFDLVHCHGYSLKIAGAQIPIILSDSSSNYLFLKDYLNWPEWRIKIGYWLRRQLFRKLGVVDCDTNWQLAKKIVVLSKFAERVHRSLGVPAGKLGVVYPGIPIQSSHSGVATTTRESLTGNRFYRSLRSLQNDKNLVNILFVGIWFVRKGGPLLLEAFKKLSAKYPNVTLTIIGEVPKKYKEEPYSSNEMRSYRKILKPYRSESLDSRQVQDDRLRRGKFSLRSNNIEQYDFVPREKLMREIFPKADIFVLVPPKVEGFGFVVLEAMSFGIPTIVSRVCALPELVLDGKTGFVVEPGNLGELVEKLERLITNRKLRHEMGSEARKRYNIKFSIKVMQKVLREVYEKAII
ncbi:glycosyltransferase family 4 protein [Candidatus Curtissbacteria bacterium]|nr:glycosyltransferase family 4 protein [Candidatus Curtissbacteria bacterium]